MPYVSPKTDPTIALEKLKAMLGLPTTAPAEPDPEPQNLIPINRHNPLADRARVALAKREAQHRIERLIEITGPQGENCTTRNFSETRLIRLDTILDDPNFKNFRLTMDPVSLGELQTSINLEGLKVPIVVVEAPVTEHYYVRAGFRRTVAVRRLGWQEIPAIVLPIDTPETEEYWINIIENTAREKLSTYELANAAKMMRDRFHVKPEEFARKSSHTLDYINRLLGCMDRLPPEVLQSWQRGDRIPLDILVKLSVMNPIEAIKNLRRWLGQHRITADVALAQLKKPSATRKPEKLWTVSGIERTQKLMLAIKISNLDPKTKRLGMDIVEFCQGARNHIPGIVDENQRLPTREFVLPDPEPDEIIPLAPEDRAVSPPSQPELTKISPTDFVPSPPGKSRTSS